MDMQSVSSSNLDSVGYEPGTRTLRVRFLSGGIYDYHGVPNSIFNGLLSASSKGTYHHQHIKDNYPFTKIA